MSTQTAAYRPQFQHGQRVIVAPEHARAYPRRARESAVGIITDVGRRVRGERKYSVRFPDVVRPDGAALPIRIPEAHLRAVDGQPEGQVAS